MELEFLHDCDEDCARLDNGKSEVVCIWIGTIWDDLDDETPWPQLMVLRKSIGMGGRNASPGAYERIGITSFETGCFEEKPLAERVVAWFKEAEVTEVTIV